MEPCAWQGQNGHITYRGIKGGIRIYYSLELSLSLFLSFSYKHLTDLIVGGGSAGQPPAGLSCFAGLDTDKGTSLMMPRHRTKIASTIGTVCGNDVVVHTKTQNGDRWSGAPFAKKGRVKQIRARAGRIWSQEQKIYSHVWRFCEDLC